MPKNVRGITVEIGGDTTKLGKALKDTEQQTKSVQKELKLVNTALKFNPANLELITQKQRLLTQEIDLTSDKLDKLKAAEASVVASFEAGEIGEEQMISFRRELIETESKLRTYTSQLEETGKRSTELGKLTTAMDQQEQEVNQLKEAYKNAVLTYGENSDEAKKLASEITHLSGELRDNKAKMADLDKAADSLDQSLDQTDESARQASEGFTVLKGTIANLAAEAIKRTIDALVDLGKKAVDVGMSFESSMSNNAALFKVSGKALEDLSETAQHYGETTVFSASEAADALGYMALAGWDAQKATQELGGVLNLAAASGMGLAQASDMVTDYLSAFSNTEITAAKFADELAYAQANSNTTAQQMGEAYKNSAANLNAAGQSVETVTALLAGMANQGLKGSESGTALTAMMRDLTKQMDEGAVMIGETSVAVQDADGNYRNLIDILKDVEKATNGMGSAEKAAALGTTFTADSIKGLNLILNDGVDNAASFADALRGANGSASAMAETMNDNLAGSLKLLQSNVESKMIKVFDRAKGSIRDSVDSVSDSLDTVDWDKVGDKVGDLAEGAAKLIDYVVDHSDEVQSALTAFGGTMATVFVVDKVANFTNSLTTLIGTTKALWGVMLANPVGATVVGLGALALALTAVKEAQEAAIEENYGLSDAEKKLISAIEDEKRAIDEVNAARAEANKGIDSEASQSRALWEELQTIVDANGEIKEGYEDRAEVITGLLSDALGIEIEIIDGQIQKYDELNASIEEVINSKRAEALLEANKEAYTQAIQNSATAYSNYAKAMKESENTARDLAKAEEEHKKLEKEMSAAMNEAGQITGDVSTRYSENMKILETLRAKQDEQNESLATAKDNYFNYINTIQNYEGLMAAVADGDVAELQSAMDNLSNSFVTAENASREMLEDQLARFSEQYEIMKQAVEAGMPGVTQANVDAMADMVEKAKGELDKLGPEAGGKGVEAGQRVADGLSSTAGLAGESAAGLVAEAATRLASGDTSTAGYEKGSEYAAALESTRDAVASAGSRLAGETVTEMTNAASQEAGVTVGTNYAGGVTSTTGAANTAGNAIGTAAANAAGAVDANGAGQKTGSQYAGGVSSKTGSAYSAGRSLGTNAESGARSVDAYGSGENFGQGFINGIGSMVGAAWDKAYSLARQAWAGLRSGQQEGSPSKLTYQSGEFFGEGYINAIREKTKAAMAAAAEMGRKTAAALGVPDFSADLGMTPAIDTSTIGSLDGSYKRGSDLGALLARLDALEDSIRNMKLVTVLDDGTLVGHSINKIDSGLAGVYSLKARGI